MIRITPKKNRTLASIAFSVVVSFLAVAGCAGTDGSANVVGPSGDLGPDASMGSSGTASGTSGSGTGTTGGAAGSAAGSTGTSGGTGATGGSGASGGAGATTGATGSAGAATGAAGTTGATTGTTGAGGGGKDAAADSSGGASGGSDAGGTASCLDGLKDGDETGVDCGGSCPACVSYQISPPNTSGNVKNACTDSGNVSFICPRFMVFSPEMKQAEADDASDNSWPAGSFNYGVATLDGAACCDCYQMVYSSPQNSAVQATPPKPLIVQNFNQGGAPNAFDVFMGKGGEGAQTNGCPQMYSTYPSTGEPSGGGITAQSISACGGNNLSSQACASAVTSDCDQIQASSSYLETTTQNSCIETNNAQSLYHINWNVKAQRIECPMHLTQVTGCRLNSQGLPKADPTVQTPAQASSWSSYGTTTMQDCCKPSCAWPTNVSNTQSPYSAMYQCGADGTPMTN
jgi:hypothetical protein